MSNFDEPEHRIYRELDTDRVTLREDLEGDDGVFVVRMPLASTGEVRNQGDDPLTREEIDGMREQVATRSPGVFLDHGSNMDISGSRYSAVGKVGEWENPELVENDAGETLLEADARLMDPETLPAATGSVREALAAVKSQVERSIGLSSSIGWRDDDSMPGGVDLMEASIVGIPADPRTTTQSAAMARGVVMGPSEHRHVSSQQAAVARDVLDVYRNEQGDGAVENFETWLRRTGRGQFDDQQLHATITALEEWYRATSPLEEPVTKQFLPFLDDRSDDSGGEDGGAAGDDSEEGGDARDSVTDSNSTQSGSDGADNTNDGQDDIPGGEEYRAAMLEQQRQQTEILRDLVENRADDEDEDDEDDEEEDDDDEQSQDATTQDTIVVDGEERDLDDVAEELESQHDELRALRESGVSLSDLDFDADEREQDAADDAGGTEPDAEQNADPRDLL